MLHPRWKTAKSSRACREFSGFFLLAFLIVNQLHASGHRYTVSNTVDVCRGLLEVISQLRVLLETMMQKILQFWGYLALEPGEVVPYPIEVDFEQFGVVVELRIVHVDELEKEHAHSKQVGFIYIEVDFVTVLANSAQLFWR